MQYHSTQEVPAEQWDNQQESVIEEMRRQAQHDLAAQNPGSDVTVEGVQHTVRDNASLAEAHGAPNSYKIEFVFEYTVGPQPNMYDA